MSRKDEPAGQHTLIFLPFLGILHWDRERPHVAFQEHVFIYLSLFICRFLYIHTPIYTYFCESTFKCINYMPFLFVTICDPVKINLWALDSKLEYIPRQIAWSSQPQCSACKHSASFSEHLAVCVYLCVIRSQERTFNRFPGALVHRPQTHFPWKFQWKLCFEKFLDAFLPSWCQFTGKVGVALCNIWKQCRLIRVICVIFGLFSKPGWKMEQIIARRQVNSYGIVELQEVLNPRR